MALRDSVGRALEVFGRFLLHNWHSIVATVAVVGYLASSFVPSNSPRKLAYQDFFVTLGMVAALLILFEIKSLLVGKEDAARSRTLRDAAPDIVKNIRDNVSRGHKGTLEIHILGGRIRTIADMMRGVLNDVKSENLPASDVKFTVYCFDPDFLINWTSPNVIKPGFAERNQRYKQQIVAAIEELMAFNDSQVFIAHRIKVEVVKYRTFPGLYAILIGNECVYFGAFTWNSASEDFEGPENPCYLVGKRDHTYRDVRDYVENRAAFYRITSTIEYQ